MAGNQAEGRTSRTSIAHFSSTRFARGCLAANSPPRKPTVSAPSSTNWEPERANGK